MTKTHDPIVFAVPGDLHLTEPGLENYRVAQWMVEELNNLIRPDFVQFIGDNVQDATEGQFRIFNEIREQLRAPHYALVGDHDIKDDPEANGFREHFAETYGSTSLRGFRFVRLNTQQAKPVGLNSSQVDWFRHELDAAASSDERVLVFQHNYPYQIWEDFSGPGIDEWRAIIQTQRINAFVCGHTHYWQVANDGRNVYVATRSIGDPEGGPPGYCIGYVHGEDLAFTYRSVQDVGPVVLITHPCDLLLATRPSHIVMGCDTIRVRIWANESVVDIRGSIDNSLSFPLISVGNGDWVAPLPGDQLEKGEHTLRVEVAVSTGENKRQEIQFMVDATGRYTAVPDARPRVMRTEFC